MLFDTHVHLLDNRFKEDLNEIIKDIKILCMVDPKADKQLFKKLLLKNNIWGACGIHPHDAKDAFKMWNELDDILNFNKVVAVGEIGLDFYYNNSPHNIQKEVFISQLKIALNKELPIIIHSRDAFKETVDILKKTKNERILIHCFGGNQDDLKEVIDRNYYVSVGGIITFPNAKKLRKIIKTIPMELLLVETDSPYLAPQPKRGKRNQPSYVQYVVDEISRLKSIDFDEVAEITNCNAIRFFDLQPLEIAGVDDGI